MIGLVGGANSNANTDDKGINKVGHNDDQIYRLEVPDDLASLMSSSSSSSLSSDENEDGEDDNAYDGEQPINTHTKADEVSPEGVKAATAKPAVESNGLRKNSLNTLIFPSAATTPSTTNSVASLANSRLSRPHSNNPVLNDLQVNPPVDSSQLNSRIPSTTNIVAAQMKSNTSPTFLQSPGISTYSPV
ncbi:hypothetical protein PMKS-000819 [Pichia membranifaciens]|uniref:Uncharacterized protein n=1 Tax=Pichia membranifaciens TaxID=4926 RepID=A0A1Q2YCT3_9ASCO|nr:hypothetical protein PMKS-000819 [Pichia membranifaciens]